MPGGLRARLLSLRSLAASRPSADASRPFSDPRASELRVSVLRVSVRLPLSLLPSLTVSDQLPAREAFRSQPLPIFRPVACSSCPSSVFARSQQLEGFALHLIDSVVPHFLQTRTLRLAAHFMPDPYPDRRSNTPAPRSTTGSPVFLLGDSALHILSADSVARCFFTVISV